MWDEVYIDEVSTTERMGTCPGGWLYRTIVSSRQFTADEDKVEMGVTVALAFVPDA